VPNQEHQKHPKPEKRGDHEPSLRPFWSGTLSFGLVSVPVDVYAGTRAGGVSLRMIAPDGTPLSRRYYCPEDDVEVPNEELTRGYEIAKDEYVTVTDEELAALEPEKSRDIDLRLFVPSSAIDPVYFERSFFLAPAGDSTKAYRLLAEVMQRSDRVGIATFVMREKEYLVAIAAHDGLLRAEALRFHEEVRSIEGVGLPKPPELAPDAVKRFESLIEKHASKAFDPSALHDEAAEALRKLAADKQRRKRDVVKSEAAEPAAEARADVIDLMEILKRSLQGEAKTEPSTAAGKSRRNGARSAHRNGTARRRASG
jgi:DNA end-binding protein Ku